MEKKGVDEAEDRYVIGARDFSLAHDKLFSLLWQHKITKIVSEFSNQLRTFGCG